MAAKRRKKISRRPKGAGSIYPLKNGRWQVALEIDGTLHRRNAPDRAAAELALANLQDLKIKAIDIGSGGQLLRVWLGVWLDQMARDVKPRTLADYRRQIETYILPVLGEMPLDGIKANHIQDFLNRIVDGIRENTKYSGTRTARMCAIRLTQAFDLAVARKLIRESPMAGVILPKDKAAKITPPSEGQVAAFLVVAGNHPLAALWHAYALLGLRRGEGLGIRWQDVDFAAETITIRQQVQAIPGRKGVTKSYLLTGDPKSDAGERTLPAPAALLALLRLHRVAQLTLRAKRADTWEDNDLVFCSRDGRPLWPRSVADEWYALRAAAKLPETTKLHHLRHALATMLDESGATEALKAGILGHETKSVTQHYTHARIAAMRQVLETVASKVLKKAG